MDVTSHEQETAERATRYRELNVAIAQTLAAYFDVHRAMEHVLELMGTELGWQFGTYWQPDAEALTLSCAATWSDPTVDLSEFEEDTRARVFALNEGVLGAAWESGEPRWISDIQAEPGFLRTDLAGRSGLRAAVLIPIPSGPEEHNHALIEFLGMTISEADDDLMEMLRTMSIFVHQYVQLRRAELDLQRLVNTDTLDEAIIEQLEAARVALQQSDEANFELLAMASHELRTPLTSIMGFTSTMLELGDTLDGDQKRQYLEIVKLQTARLQRLVDDLHLYSRVESGRIPVHAGEVDVAVAVQQVVRELDVHDVGIDCPPDVLAWADRDHVQQILANYLSNAVKYGGAPVTVESHRAEGSIIITVCDEGPGVAEDFLPRLFERFERDGDRPEVKGSGLGLSIVRGLARAQGGDAWHEPNEPRGSRFCIRLPHATAT